MARQRLVAPASQRDDGGVVRGGVRERLERERAAGLVGERAVVRAQLVEHAVVLLGARDDADPRVVLRRGARPWPARRCRWSRCRATRGTGRGCVTTRSNGAMPCGFEVGEVAARSRGRRGCPPWIFGCSVIDAARRASRATPVTSSTVVTGTPASAERGGRAARRHQLEPEVVQPACEVDEAGLVAHREQGALAHARPPRCISRSTCGYRRRSTSLIALVERLGGVVGQDRHRFLGEDRARRRPRAWRAWTVQPVTLTPAASASSTACQPLNAGSSDGCVFVIAAAGRRRGSAARGSSRTRPSRRGRPRGASGRRPPAACTAEPVEVGAEGRRARRARRGSPASSRDVDRSARSVDHDDADRQAGVDQRLEDGPASRRQHPDPPHIGKLPEGRVPARDLASAGTRW